MIKIYFLRLIDAFAFTGAAWISLVMLGGYADDEANYVLVFFLATLWLAWRFL